MSKEKSRRASPPMRADRALELQRHLRDVPDFPRPGILFRDISPLLRNHFEATIAALDETLGEAQWQGVEVLAGIESRGFILAAALAARRRKGFVAIRKQGKLPPPVIDIGYELEYGSGVLEIQKGAGRLLLVDDVLATGGTMRAAAEVSRKAGYTVCGLLVLVDLGLTADFRWENLGLRSVIRYG